MPKNIPKSLQKYMSKIKRKAPHLQISRSTLSSTTSKIFSGCKHPKSLSFAFEHKGKKDHNDDDQDEQNDEAATLEDIDKYLIENFKSLYVNGRDSNVESILLRDDKEINGSESGSVIYDSSIFLTSSPLDKCGSSSHHFLTSPVYASSPIGDASVSGAGTSTSDDVGSLLSSPVVDSLTRGREHIKDDDKSAIPNGVEDCIAVLTVSPSPYEDFRRSMKGVLDARILNNQRVDWDFMEGLLICHLRLNEKKQHKFILSAFVDLIVVLRENSSEGGLEGSRGSDGRRQ